MTMHAGSLATSVHLQALHEYLSDGKLHTTQDILDNTPLAAVSPAISALRKNGCVIDCRYRETTPTGAKVYEYRMLTGQISLIEEAPQP